MTRKIFSKVMWVGRTAATLFGLALVMALVFGVATTAIGATGGNFILGKANGATTVSKLTASIAGPALTLVNNSTAAAATALNISVASGKAPLKVNAAAGTATNLSADKLDGKDSGDFASSYKRTVVVSPVGTDAQNGTALLNALSGITDASATKPYLLYIEAGTYDLGSSALQMKQHVDIQGAGELKTVITSIVQDNVGETQCSSGTVRGANDAELRFLTVRNTGAGGDCNIAIYNDSASPLLTHVRAESSAGAGSQHVGVYNRSSNPTMTSVTATASSGAGGEYYAVFNQSSSPTITHSKLTGSSSSLYQNSGTAKVALTQLVGAISKGPSGTLQCFDNYNGSLGAVTCP